MALDWFDLPCLTQIFYLDDLASSYYFLKINSESQKVLYRLNFIMDLAEWYHVRVIKFIKWIGNNYASK